MVPFGVAMKKELRAGSMETGLPDQNQPVQTGLFDASHKPLCDGLVLVAADPADQANQKELKQGHWPLGRTLDQRLVAEALGCAPTDRQFSKAVAKSRNLCLNPAMNPVALILKRMLAVAAGVACLLALSPPLAFAAGPMVSLVIRGDAAKPVQYGLGKLRGALQAIGASVEEVASLRKANGKAVVLADPAAKPAPRVQPSAITGDGTAPQVIHQSVLSSPTSKSLTITAQVLDPAGVKWVRVRYRSVNQHQDYLALTMGPTGDKDEYRAVIPLQDIPPTWDLMYFIEAMDKDGNGRIHPDLSKETPYVVVRLQR